MLTLNGVRVQELNEAAGTTRSIQLDARFIEPQRGTFAVNLICRKFRKPIGRVRIERHFGAVLWATRTVDQEEPSTPFVLDDGEATATLWCPKCGSTDVDLDEVRTTVSKARTAKTPEKMYV